MTHTPGPWRISALDGRTIGPARELVLHDTTFQQLQAVAIVTPRLEETAGNAALIAAAPELLAVLARILEGELHAADDARAVIAKVEGAA